MDLCERAGEQFYANFIVEWMTLQCVGAGHQWHLYNVKKVKYFQSQGWKPPRGVFNLSLRCNHSSEWFRKAVALAVVIQGSEPKPNAKPKR